MQQGSILAIGSSAQDLRTFQRKCERLTCLRFPTFRDGMSQELLKRLGQESARFERETLSTGCFAFHRRQQVLMQNMLQRPRQTWRANPPASITWRQQQCRWWL